MNISNTNSNAVITDENGTDSPLPAHQLRYMVEHSSCAMCDTKLEIRHEINKNDWKLKEEAHCPSCGIRVRSAHHILH